MALAATADRHTFTAKTETLARDSAFATPRVSASSPSGTSMLEVRILPAPPHGAVAQWQSAMLVADSTATANDRSGDYVAHGGPGWRSTTRAAPMPAVALPRHNGRHEPQQKGRCRVGRPREYAHSSAAIRGARPHGDFPESPTPRAHSMRRSICSSCTAPSSPAATSRARSTGGVASRTGPPRVPSATDSLTSAASGAAARRRGTRSNSLYADFPHVPLGNCAVS